MMPTKRYAPPALIRDIPGWVIWRFEDDNGKPTNSPLQGDGRKARKVPYHALGSRRRQQGTAADVAHLVTFDAANRAAATRGFAGVGFAPLPQFNVTIIDFDDCVDADGNVNHDVACMTIGTFAELSPSRKGVHAFYTGTLPSNRKSNSIAGQWGFEVFSSTGFVTYTGEVLEMTELTASENIVAPITEGVLAEYQRRFGQGEAQSEAPPRGLTEDQLEQMLKAINPSGGYRDWVQVGMALHHETHGEGFELWDSWSASSSKYPGREILEAKWDTFGRYSGGAVTVGTLLKLSRDAGAVIEGVNVASDDDFEVIEPEPDEPGKAHRHPVALDWHAFPEDPPDPAFVIPGWMPDKVVTLFAAHGGTGKSYMSLYISLCLATGRHPFLPGAPLERVKVMLYSAEDNMEVMQSRIARYLRLLGIERSELAGWLHILDATECDNVLFTDDRQAGSHTTARFTWLANAVQAFGASVLVFDNASDAMDANENDRAKVRQFMSCLKRVAPAVLLLAHVDASSSMADPNDAKGYSGSTGWHNSARSRWFMSRQKDSDDILLTLPKVNYAKAGSQAVLRWSDAHKVFEVVSSREGKAKAIDNRVVLLGLVQVALESGRRISPSHTVASSVFNTIKDMDGFPSGLESKHVRKEVNAWMTEELVAKEAYTATNRVIRECLVLTEKGIELAKGASGVGLDAEI